MATRLRPWVIGATLLLALALVTLLVLGVLNTLDDFHRASQLTGNMD